MADSHDTFVILDFERMNIENGNCLSVCAYADISIFLTNENVFIIQPSDLQLVYYVGILGLPLLYSEGTHRSSSFSLYSYF